MTKLTTLKTTILAAAVALTGIATLAAPSSAMSLAQPAVATVDTQADVQVHKVGRRGGFRGGRGFRRFGGFRGRRFHRGFRGRRFHRGFRGRFRWRHHRRWGHRARFGRRAHCLALQARGYRIACY